MKSVFKPWSLGLILSVAAGVAGAQQPPAPQPASPRSNAQMEAGEPRANGVPGPEAAPQPTRSPKATAARPPRAGSPPTPPGPKTAADRLNLNTATVTGDREQPKVMYVVPWKSPNIGDLSGKPMNSLLDEALAPVDRDEFKREVAYYDAVRGDTSKNGTAIPATKQGEK